MAGGIGEADCENDASTFVGVFCSATLAAPRSDDFEAAVLIRKPSILPA
jgi:hypothetical protein